jgi:hypothetical protein
MTDIADFDKIPGVTVSLKSKPDHNYDYIYLQKYIGQLYIKQYPSDSALLELHGLSYKDKDKPEVFYRIPENKLVTLDFSESSETSETSESSESSVPTKTALINCYWYKISDVKALSSSIESLDKLVIKAPTKEILDKFIIDACKQTDKLKTLHIYHYNVKESCWDTFGKVQKRDESTIIIKKEDKDKLFEDVAEFVKSEDEYDAHGIAYKRNYLFYGNPELVKHHWRMLLQINMIAIFIYCHLIAGCKTLIYMMQSTVSKVNHQFFC